jgi:predicted Fe-Mo cluster-binding NifX family protein
MLLLIGSEGDNLQSRISMRFGHANYFIIYNTQTKDFKAAKNIHEGNHHANLYGYLEKGIEAFIVGNIGPHAFEIVNTPKSKVYLAKKMSVEEAIEKFLKNELQLLTEPTAKRSIGDDHKNKNSNHFVDME